MTKEDINVIDICILASELLLYNGAEVFRVRDTVTRIAQSYDVCDFEIYVLSTGIFMSISEDGEHYSTSINSVPLPIIHLGRVAEICNLSRRIVEQGCSLETVYEELNRIKQIPYNGISFKVVCAAIASSSFCYFLGGGLIDIFASIIAGAVLHLFLAYIARKQISKMMINILGAAVATICCLIMHNLNFCKNIDTLISASIISLVPGVALTNGIRDLFSSDYLSGTIKLIDAILVAFSIAVGVGGILIMWKNLFGGYLL
ncbi:hypothetical protein AN641_02120 [Candidatus Epulonipiscioides gigas]|nr:hypothetical protein AN641_02120 [Epulopiscium sp. SCG-C07WGA-EpuloA2]